MIFLFFFFPFPPPLLLFTNAVTGQEKELCLSAKVICVEPLLGPEL